MILIYNNDNDDDTTNNKQKAKDSRNSRSTFLFKNACASQ